MSMLITVGSTNPTKIQAVVEVVKEYPTLFLNAEVKGVKVNSSVNAQPLSKDELIKGAIERAKAAFIEGTTYSIGIESGIYPQEKTTTGWLNTCACVIYNGKRNFIGLSPSFEYPLKVIELVLNEKLEVSDAIKKTGLTNHNKLGYEQGVIGLLTKGKIDRNLYTRLGLIMALLQLEHPELYPPSK